MVIFHSYVNVYQRVTEATTTKEKRVETMIWTIWEHWTSSKHHACTIPASQNTIKSDWYHLPIIPAWTLFIQISSNHIIMSFLPRFVNYRCAFLHLSWWCCNSLDLGRAFLPAHPPASSADGFFGWWDVGYPKTRLVERHPVVYPETLDIQTD